MITLRRQLGLFLIIALLSGCATSARYGKVLDSWIGAPESDLVKSWGPPDSVYVADDDTRMLTYYSTRMVSFPGSSISDRHRILAGESIYTNTYGHVPGEVRVYNCKTSFTLVQRRVTSWRWDGNGCR